jgi:hypothetical protein
MTGLYDPIADRMIVFGGWTGSQFKNDVWALSLSGTPAWTLLTPSGTPPSPRREYMAAYDPLHQRVLYVGGTLPDPPFASDETWELDLSGPPAWNNLSPGAPRPSARFGGAAVHDPDKDRLLLFGGYDGDYRNDTWGLSLSGAPVWEELEVNLPVPTQRFMAAGVLDRPRDRFVIFGGYDLNYRSDVWGLGLSGLDWNELVPVTSPPSGRMVTGTIHDPVRDRMIVFGGHPEFLNDLWAFELGGTPKWDLLPVIAGPTPAPRWGHYAVYDSRRDRLVSFGGITAGGISNEVWTIPLEGMLTWELLTPGGTAPPPLHLGASVYDPVRDRLVVFGGFGADTFQNQAWALSFDGTPTWTQLSPAGVPPVGRDLMSGVYDPVRDRMVIFGGWDGSSYRDDVWALNFAGGESWIQLAPEGMGPSARREYTAIFDATRYRMVLFGGTNGDGYHNDVWELQWDAPVSARPSLVSSSAGDGRVSLTWYASGGLRSGMVERRQENTLWLELGSTVADGAGYLTYLDDGVPDGRYAYRLKYGSETGLETTDEVWVVVASSDGFGLHGAVPHPARDGALTVDFTVPDDRPMTIELMTAGGRRVLVRELGGLGAGRHRVALASERSIPGGVYWLRASYAGSVRTKRVVVLD